MRFEPQADKFASINGIPYRLRHVPQHLTVIQTGKQIFER